MADLSQVPGILNLSLARGDDLPLVCDFDFALTGGYSFSSQVDFQDGTSLAIPVSGTFLVSGVLTAYFMDTDDWAIGDHNWYLRWVVGGSGNGRKILAGEFKLVPYEE